MQSYYYNFIRNLIVKPEKVIVKPEKVIVRTRKGNS